jgi:hypothetical protein
MILDLYNEEPLILAVDNTTTFNLSTSPYSGLIATTTSSHAIGVASCNIPANGFGWVQTYGFCSTLIQGSITKGNGVQQSTSVAGAVTTFTGSNALLGNTLENCTSGQYNGVWLQIT